MGSMRANEKNIMNRQGQTKQQWASKTLNNKIDGSVLSAKSGKTGS
jgi:hypothetical protein